MFEQILKIKGIQFDESDVHGPEQRLAGSRGAARPDGHLLGGGPAPAAS